VTFYLAFNTKRPPFNNRKARQAVNYVLDRNRVVQLAAGEDQNRPTCQVLPPNFPGYRPYCPYTLPGASQAWTAPDAARATRLIAASGTKGARVTLWVPRQPAGIRLATYLQQVLGSLGYRVQLRSSFKELLDVTTHEPCLTPTRRCRWKESVHAYFGALGQPGAAPQMLWSGWVADFPSPSNFIQALFSCGESGNFAHVCDRALDRRIGRALRAEQADRAGANELWAELDREVTNKALAVPLYNTYGKVLVSRRIGNYRDSPMRGTLLSQLSVR